MEERYDASGYGWDDEDKERELTEDGARFLLCRWADDADSLDQGELCAIAHFRFSVQGECLSVSLSLSLCVSASLFCTLTLTPPLTLTPQASLWTKCVETLAS